MNRREDIERARSEGSAAREHTREAEEHERDGEDDDDDDELGNVELDPDEEIDESDEA